MSFAIYTVLVSDLLWRKVWKVQNDFYQLPESFSELAGNS